MGLSILCKIMCCSTRVIWHLVAPQVCFYRDKQSINKFKLATVTAAGVKISEPFMLDTKWNYKVSLYSPTSLSCGILAHSNL